MASFKDRVAENTTTTGTGAITLSGPPSVAYSAFSQSFVSGETPFYSIVAVDSSGNPTGQWEIGQDTNYGGGTTLNRSIVLSYSSSNGDSNPVNFAAGTKQVFNVIPAVQMQNLRSDELTAFYGAI